MGWPTVQIMTPEERRKSQRVNQDYFSDKISELSRYIGFGLAAVAFTLLSSDSAFAKSLGGAENNLLIATAGIGCLTLLMDYLQLCCGWASASIAARNSTDKYKMTRGSRAFRCFQNIFYYGKQFSAFVGVITLITMVGITATSNVKSTGTNVLCNKVACPPPPCQSSQ